MLLQENFTEKYIRELQKTSHRDPILLERAVYAFGLLEALAKVGMPFIFKGGTCLLSDTEYLCVNDYAGFLDMKIEQEKLASLRYMKKVNPEAYSYAIKTDRILVKLQG